MRWGCTSSRIPSLGGETPEQAAACKDDPLSSSPILAIISSRAAGTYGFEANSTSDDGAIG